MQNLSDASVVKDLLGRHGFKFSKALGQNFLINPTVCPRMAEVCGADENTGVIEVGPGFGVLTAELAKKAKKVVSIELDERLLPVLDETLSEFDNVKIINADILKVDLKKIIEEEFSGMKVAVCANLPYYITSPVIMHLLESRLPIENLTVMVQKEAAQRLCAPVGSRDAGAVTVAVDFYSDAKKAFDVSAGSFMPAPKVDSSVIKLDIRKQPPIELKDEKLFSEWSRLFLHSAERPPQTQSVQVCHCPRIQSTPQLKTQATPKLSVQRALQWTIWLYWQTLYTMSRNKNGNGSYIVKVFA